MYNLATLQQVKDHLRIEHAALDSVIDQYIQAVAGEIRLLTDNPTLFDTAVEDEADLAALVLLQCLLVADLVERPYASTAAPSEVRWSNHTLALADKFRDYRELYT